MTIFNKIFALSKKTTQALLKGKSLTDLEETDLFSEETKSRILKNLSEEKINEHIKLLRNLDKDKDWKKVLDNIKPRKKTPTFQFYAAASIILLVSIAYISIVQHSKKIDSKIVEIQIEVGVNKATLTLNDGSDVILEKGSIYLTENITSNGEQLVYAEKNNAVSKINYNYLTVPRGGQFQIKLSDGSEVWLNSDSKLKYPVTFANGETRVVELLYGEAYFDISSSTAHNGAKFKVRTQMQEVEVLGTEFNIKAYRDENHIYTTLVEGKVSVATKHLTERLSPGEQSILNTESKSLVTAIVDVSYDISWKKGLFSFKDKSLKEIMKVLSRWYDVEVSFENEALEKVKFNGVLNKNQTLNDILNGIKNTKFINAYDIENKKITIN
jgi:ferric-dicitrate binding protein FerR (iron transport regulator)